jgi:hypothetical protein
MFSLARSSIISALNGSSMRRRYSPEKDWLLRPKPAPAKPVGISPPAFWPWFDSLPKEARDQIDYALNGPALVEAYHRAWSKHQSK